MSTAGVSAPKGARHTLLADTSAGRSPCGLISDTTSLWLVALILHHEVVSGFGQVDLEDDVVLVGLVSSTTSPLSFDVAQTAPFRPSVG